MQKESLTALVRHHLQVGPVATAREGHAVPRREPAILRSGRKLREKKIATLGRSVAEGHEREKATAEILAVISRSPTDAQPVFDGIANGALHLIGGVSQSGFGFARTRAGHSVSGTVQHQRYREDCAG